MWLVLCEPADPSGPWVAEGLAGRGLDPVEVVTRTDLDGAVWEHRIGGEGCRVRARLRDGRSFDSRDLCGVINRLAAMPAADLARADPSDLDYASQETYAFFVSWLASLPEPTFNLPTPRALWGPALDLLEWQSLGCRSGFATLGPDEAPPDEARQVLVVGERTVPQILPAGLSRACRRLAAAAGVSLLEVVAARGPRGWVLAGASELPDLRRGGDEFLVVLAGELRKRAAWEAAA